MSSVRTTSLLRRPLAIWGLRASARVHWDRQAVTVDARDRLDAHLALGYAHAALHLARFDLARRVWSGRISEVLGARPIDGSAVSTLELDRFLRVLDLRRDAELSFRRLDSATRAALEAFCRGVNAYIDTGRWARDATFPLLETRPRFWAPVDALLLAEAPLRVAGLRWTDPPPLPLLARVEALSLPALRAEGAVAGEWRVAVDGALRGEGPVGLPADLVPKEVQADVRLRTVQRLPGDGGQRYLDPDDLQPRRFSIERVDLAERGGSGWSGEIRRAFVSECWDGTPLLWQWSGAQRPVLLPLFDAACPPSWRFVRTLPSPPFDWTLEPRR